MSLGNYFHPDHCKNQLKETEIRSNSNQVKNKKKKNYLEIPRKYLNPENWNNDR